MHAQARHERPRPDAQTARILREADEAAVAEPPAPGDMVAVRRAADGFLRWSRSPIDVFRVEDVQIVELQKFFGIEVNHVYYDSGGTLFTDLLTGDLDVIITASIQYADNPDVRIMTLLAKGMTENFPYKQIPTLADYQKQLNYNVNDLRTLGTTQFNGLMVKAGLPDDVYQRLVVAFKNVVTNPEWQKKVASYRFPVYYPPEQAKAIYDNLNLAIQQMVADTKK